MLADRVLTDLQKDIRQKYEQLITDLVHQREVTQQLINQEIQSMSDFAWLYHMRFYFNHKQKNALEQLQIKVANGNFFYGFEYLGVFFDPNVYVKGSLLPIKKYLLSLISHLGACISFVFDMI